jgi:hypothetical protein
MHGAVPIEVAVADEDQISRHRFAEPWSKMFRLQAKIPSGVIRMSRNKVRIVKRVDYGFAGPEILE